MAARRGRPRGIVGYLVHLGPQPPSPRRDINCKAAEPVLENEDYIRIQRSAADKQPQGKQAPRYRLQQELRNKTLAVLHSHNPFNRHGKSATS